MLLVGAWVISFGPTGLAAAELQKYPTDVRAVPR